MNPGIVVGNRKAKPLQKRAATLLPEHGTGLGPDVPEGGCVANRGPLHAGVVGKPVRRSGVPLVFVTGVAQNALCYM